jgi:hypothetical protein
MLLQLHRFDAPVGIPDPLSRSLMLPNYEPSNDDVTEERYYARMSGSRLPLLRATTKDEDAIDRLCLFIYSLLDLAIKRFRNLFRLRSQARAARRAYFFCRAYVYA